MNERPVASSNLAPSDCISLRQAKKGQRFRGEVEETIYLVNSFRAKPHLARSLNNQRAGQASFLAGVTACAKR